MSAQPAASELFIYRKLTDQQVGDYRRLGYLLYGPILSEEGLRLMREECMRAWTAEKGPYDPSKTWLENGLLINVHRHSDLARRYYFSGPLVDVAERLVSPNVKGATSQLTFKMRGNNKPVQWHQDNGYGELDPYTAISCLTALDDTTQENGCLWIIPGSHLKGQISVGDAGSAEAKKAMKEIRVEADESRAVPVPMKAGECLIFGPWTLHKSDGNFSDRDRRILFLRYADADAVEVYNGRKPRLGRLVRGTTRFDEVRAYEADLPLN